MKKANKKLIEGLVAGAVVGAVAAGVAAMEVDSKKLKKIAGSAKKLSSKAYQKAAPNIRKFKDVSEREYHRLIKKSIPAYAKARKLSKKEVASVLNEVKKYWREVKKYL